MVNGQLTVFERVGVCDLCFMFNTHKIGVSIGSRRAEQNILGIGGIRFMNRNRA